MTDAHPLIPQAQGISEGVLAATSLRANGKGIPMKNHMGATRKTAARIFATCERAIRPTKMGLKRNKKITTNEIRATTE